MASPGAARLRPPSCGQATVTCGMIPSLTVRSTRPWNRCQSLAQLLGEAAQLSVSSPKILTAIERAPQSRWSVDVRWAGHRHLAGKTLSFWRMSAITCSQVRSVILRSTSISGCTLRRVPSSSARPVRRPTCRDSRHHEQRFRQGAHLWWLLTGPAGNPHFGALHLLSAVFLFAGFALLSRSWHVLYHAQRRHQLAQATALLGMFCHPPGTSGCVPSCSAFLLQWPTLLTLAMFPVLVLDVRAARHFRRRDSERHSAKLGVTMLSDTSIRYRARGRRNGTRGHTHTVRPWTTARNHLLAVPDGHLRARGRRRWRLLSADGAPDARHAGCSVFCFCWPCPLSTCSGTTGTGGHSHHTSRRTTKTCKPVTGHASS